MTSSAGMGSGHTISSNRASVAGSDAGRDAPSSDAGRSPAADVKPMGLAGPPSPPAFPESAMPSPLSCFVYSSTFCATSAPAGFDSSAMPWSKPPCTSRLSEPAA